MDSTCIAILVALVIMVFLSAWFSSTETAYSSVNKIRLKSKSEDGNVRAQKALALLDQYDKLLSCILIGNNIVNLTAASLGTVLFTKLYPVYGAAISTAVLTVVVLIFGEITPKTMAKDKPEKFCMRAVPILRVLLFVLTPLHLFFGLFSKVAMKLFHTSEEEGITEEELITMVEEAESEGGLEHHESELIRAAIEFNDMEVEEILTPRVNVFALDVEEEAVRGFGKMVAEGDALVVGSHLDVHGIVAALVVGGAGRASLGRCAFGIMENHGAVMVAQDGSLAVYGSP